MKIYEGLPHRISVRSVKMFMEYIESSIYCRLGFIMDQYGWKSELPEGIWWKSSTSSLNRVFCEKFMGDKEMSIYDIRTGLY
jgi:hypothetical protein